MVLSFSLMPWSPVWLTIQGLSLFSEETWMISEGELVVCETYTNMTGLKEEPIPLFPLLPRLRITNPFLSGKVCWVPETCQRPCSEARVNSWLQVVGTSTCCCRPCWLRGAIQLCQDLCYSCQVHRCPICRVPGKGGKSSGEKYIQEIEAELSWGV